MEGCEEGVEDAAEDVEDGGEEGGEGVGDAGHILGLRKRELWDWERYWDEDLDKGIVV